MPREKPTNAFCDGRVCDVSCACASRSCDAYAFAHRASDPPPRKCSAAARAMPRSGRFRRCMGLNTGPEFAGRLERWNGSLRNPDDFARFRISTGSRGPGYHLEGAEAPNLDMLAALKRLGHRRQKPFDDGGGIGFGKPSCVRNPVDDVRLGHLFPFNSQPGHVHVSVNDMRNLRSCQPGNALRPKPVAAIPVGRACLLPMGPEKTISNPTER